MATTDGTLLACLAFGVSHNFIASLIIGAVMFAAVALLGGRALRDATIQAARRAVDADPTSAALGIHALEVTPEAVTEISSHHTLSVRREAVADAIRTSDHFFILLRSSAAMIIPLRSFATADDRDAFIQHVLQFVSLQPSVAEKRRG